MLHSDEKLDADFAPSAGMSDEEKQANLLRSAENNEIELEEGSDSEGEGDKKEAKDNDGGDKPEDKAEVQEDPADKQEETVEVGGYKIPRKAAEALVAEMERAAAEQEPARDDSKETQALEAKRNELVEKVKKAAAGDPAVEGLVELIGQLQADISAREAKEIESRKAAAQLEADRRLFAEDRADVEKEFGVKLTDDQIKVLLNTARGLKVNMLKEAYKTVYGKKTPDRAEKPRYDSVDSRRQVKAGADTLDAETVAEIRKHAKAFGINPDRVLDKLRNRSE